MNPENIYPRTNDHETVYLKNVIKNPNILVGDFTMYNDFVYDPRQFEKNNVLYHYPINHDKLIIGKFCSIACGAKFLFTSANHSIVSGIGTTKVRKSLQQVFDELTASEFIFVDRGCIVNIVQIMKVSDGEAVLKNGERLPISRSHLQEVKQKINQFWGAHI